MSDVLESRAVPVGTSCGYGELSLGRYCDRSTGYVTTWYEKCLPLKANVDTDIDGVPTSACSEEQNCYEFSDHACPAGYACVQAFDQDASAHVFCKTAPKRFSAGHDRQDWLEPFGTQGSFFRVNLASSTSNTIGGESGKVITRDFTIHTDLGTILQAVLYDPTTMKLIQLPFDIDVTVRGTPKQTQRPRMASKPQQSSTWQVRGQGALMTMTPDTTRASTKGTSLLARLTKRVRAFGRDLANAVIATTAIVTFGCLLVAGQAARDFVDHYRGRGA